MRSALRSHSPPEYNREDKVNPDLQPFHDYIFECFPCILFGANLNGNQDINLDNYKDPNADEFIEWTWTINDGYINDTFIDCYEPWKKKINFVVELYIHKLKLLIKYI